MQLVRFVVSVCGALHPRKFADSPLATRSVQGMTAKPEDVAGEAVTEIVSARPAPAPLLRATSVYKGGLKIHALLIPAILPPDFDADGITPKPQKSLGFLHHNRFYLR